MSSSDPVRVVFEKSIRDFKIQLKDDKLYSEILQTTSIDQVYDITDKLQEEQAKKGHMRHLSKIGPFLERLRDYTGTIATFVQAKPEILALIWGPIKLLVQWTSILKQSLDELVATIAEIGELIPEFKEMAEVFGYNRRIQEVLALFFQDILNIYVIALKFFSLSRWKIVFEMMWPNQREKIRLVMRHIERNTLLLRNETRLEHIRAEREARLRDLKHFEMTEQIHRGQEFNAIKESIALKTYENELKRIRDHLCNGTGKWLLKDAVFMRWLQESEQPAQLIWLQGIPGAGKTFLSCTVVNQTLTLGSTLYVFLSYNHASNTSALSIIHSLIFQLAENDDDLQAILCQSNIKELKREIERALEILITLLNTAGLVFVVIDGLDEINEIERVGLLRRLLEISKNCNKARILVSSRIEDDIQAILRDQVVGIRIDNRNAGSIQAFINRRVEEWFSERDFIPEARLEIRGLLASLSSNANGMFLYAKVVLNTIEHLDDMTGIRDELQVLPDNLDDAYKRIFKRINDREPPALRTKARRLLGWVGSSLTPLTIHEIEQALIIKMDDDDGSNGVIARLNPIRICGPILEMVGDYVQFVHFTAKEYIFSPRISDSINLSDATLNLASCCVQYLCQRHHDLDLSEEEMRRNVLSGTYRLHEYSAMMWLELIQQHLNLAKPKAPPYELIELLQSFIERRSSDVFIADTASHAVSSLGLHLFQASEPTLYEMLCNATYFQKQCLEGGYDKREENSWISLDPLTVSQTSIRLHDLFDKIPCGSSYHHIQGCQCSVLQWHYGGRPFKCSFLGCTLSRYGFPNRRDRDLHQKHHERPWKCGRSDCPYSKGFISRKMRDWHWEQGHQEGQKMQWLQQNLDDDELQPLVFDLVKADKLEAIKSLLPRFLKTVEYRVVQMNLLNSAMRFSSPAMVNLVYPDMEKRTDLDRGYSTDFAGALTASIEGNNVDTFRHVLPLSRNRQGFIKLLPEILKSKSEEFRTNWESEVEADYTAGTMRRREWNAAFSYRYTSKAILKHVTGNPHNEAFVCSIWKKADFSKNMTQTNLGDALGRVAQTCCSTKLAKYLIDTGASVDRRRSVTYMTPLHHAVTHDTPEAAELIKFLLGLGACPTADARPSEKESNNQIKYRRKPRWIRDEVGAQGISKWLGMSWEDLVMQMQPQRIETETNEKEEEKSR